MDMGDLSMPNMEQILESIKDRIDFPATKEMIVEEAGKAPGMADEAKDWLTNNLPDGMYKSIEEVKDALGM